MSNSTGDYTWLRKHIYGQFRLIAQVFTASVIAVGALLGYIINSVFTSDIVLCSEFSITPFIFLAPLAVAIPCAYFIGELRKEIFKWGTYVEVYLEDREKLNYETELGKYRVMFPESESLNPIAITYWVFAILCGLLFWHSLYLAGMCYLWLLILFVPFVFLGVWFKGYKDIPYKYSKRYRENWTRVKERSDGGNDQISPDELS